MAAKSLSELEILVRSFMSLERVTAMKPLFRFPLAAAMLAAMTAAGCKSGHEDQTERTLAAADLPPAVSATVKAQIGLAPMGEIKSVVEDGKTMYVAEFLKDGHPTELEMFADGSICCIETEITFGEMPAAVQATATRETKGMKIEHVERKLSKGMTTFVVEAESKNNEDFEFEFSDKGVLISKKLDKGEDK